MAYARLGDGPATLTRGAPYEALLFFSGSDTLREALRARANVHGRRDRRSETRAGGVLQRHRLERLQSRSDAVGYFFLSEEVTFYAAPGSTVIVKMSRWPNSAGSASYTWGVSGYLVNAP